MNKNFGLIGAAGYVAPKHMEAIKKADCDLIVTLDPNDSVGVIDKYFPNAQFFKEFERFDRHIDKMRRSKELPKIDYISICSPNFLHDAHIRFSLRSGCECICEKPLVLNPWNIDGLKDIEKETGKKVNTILQLRLHPTIVELKKNIDKNTKTKYEIDLTYITPRGNWYLQSWKGEEKKSGGIATNIGVHFFDMLHFLFGQIKENKVFLRTNTKSSGFLEFENARVRWYLSIDRSDLIDKVKQKNNSAYRSITINQKELEFSSGFTDLHQLSYFNILNGKGFTLEDNRPCIETVSLIRTLQLSREGDLAHPFLSKKLSK